MKKQKKIEGVLCMRGHKLSRFVATMEKGRTARFSGFCEECNIYYSGKCIIKSLEFETETKRIGTLK